MKRRTSTAPVRVYKFGLPFGPTGATAPLVEQQMRFAQRYRNALVAHERARRAAFRELAAMDSTVSKLDAQIADVQRRIEREQERMRLASQHKKKRVPDSAGREKVKALAAESKRLRAERKRALKELPAEIQAALSDMDDRAKIWQRAERAASGLYWGTYLIIEAAAQQAAREPVDPSFQPARPYSDLVGGDGAIAVQLQKGMTVAELFSGADRRVQVAPVPDDVYSLPWGERRRRCRTLLRLRVGTDGRREPVWAEFEDMHLHRPLPHDARITWVRVQRRRIGVRHRWECLITVEAESLRAPTRLPSVTAAVDFGWRRVGDHLRIARAMTEDGDVLDLLLPMEIVHAQRFPDELRAIRDKHFDLVRVRLSKWLTEHAHPTWLAKSLATLPHWKSTHALTRVAYRWLDRRFDGDEEMFGVVDAWRRKERHLYHWEARQRSKAIGERREFYRVHAKQWAERFPRIVLSSNLDLSETQRRAPAGAEVESEAPHVYRKEAAAGEFREALIRAVVASGGSVLRADVPARTCHACGGICDAWEPDVEEHHTCENCGAAWQCDDNMCHKLHAALASGEAA